MTKQTIVKRVVDVVMTVGLLFLMAYQVTGEVYHEWIGSGMLLVFILHNILNDTFYKNVLKGNYKPLRIVRTILNFGTLVAILVTGYSGIVMSNYVFDFLNIQSGLAQARQLHLSGSYWAFILMSMHLGFHWSIITRQMNKRIQNKGIVIWMIRIVGAAIAFYGAMRFCQSDIYTYMFMNNPFAFIDYEKSSILVLLDNLAMMSTWIFIGYYLQYAFIKLDMRKRCISTVTAMLMLLCTALNFVGTTNHMQSEMQDWSSNVNQTEAPTTNKDNKEGEQSSSVLNSDRFILIKGGTFTMGSPESENWRSADEVTHEVTVNDFYMSPYEVTQEEYSRICGTNPSNFSGERLPVENVTWYDAVIYCNEKSEKEGLKPVYQIDGKQVSWNMAADGYRLPTEAEWEYACRAGTTTPFNTENSISPEDANYYGHYPYEIEANYFEQDNLTTKPGQYRETTVEVDSFLPNAWGVYNMHGNVSEWVWDYYGAYPSDSVSNPTGPDNGSLKVYRGGGWNDFAKNMRSAYRATIEPELASFNIGIRLVRNAGSGSDKIAGSNNDMTNTMPEKGKVLITYFSWGGNTKSIAEEIQSQTGGDLYEITLVEPYSEDYNTVLNESQHDQNVQARPKIRNHIENMNEYDTILLGYPNWWASIPMPIASFLEDYDLSGKRIIPFCSHGGGRFGQSLTAIAKLTPNSIMGEGLSIHYSGGNSMPSEVSKWIEKNGIVR